MMPSTKRLIRIMNILSQRIDIANERIESSDKRIDSLQEQIIEMRINPELREGGIPWT